MFVRFKQVCVFLLVLLMVCAWIPAPQAVHAAQTAEELTEEDYAAIDLLFDRIDALEESPAKRSASQEQLTDAAIEAVLASDSYVEGSLVRTSDAFTWCTDSGIRCVYSPRMRQTKAEMNPTDTVQDVIVNEPKTVKGGSPSGDQVYLIGPYYGHDDSFTNQYKNEARRVAAAIGDTDGYTLYSGTAATVDKVAEAVSNGAVVFFDSHGMTDYENGYDCVTGATNSYMCLTSTSGLTKEDYNDGALYDSEGIWINGETIANHMTKDSPGGIVWMALCLGMATDTLCEPLREKGVEVVYGYSQSVTFDGDYLFEEAFWDEMTQGSTVAEAIATMKATWGNWDWSPKIAEYYGYYDGYYTIYEARADYTAFPVVVSDEDPYPGQRSRYSYGACSLQNVMSTYSLGEVNTEITDPTDPRQILEEAYALGAGEELPYTATLTGRIISVDTAYDSYYKNVTVTMVVEDCEDMPIKCYRMKGTGADQITVDDIITVTGTIVNYQHSSGDLEVEFTAGCTLDSWVDADQSTDPSEPTTPTEPSESTVSVLSFADTANRTELSTAKQVWQQNGITVINEKTDDSSDIVNASDPVRFYKYSKLTITAQNMVKIVVNCDTYKDYAAALVDSVSATAGVTVTRNENVVTIEFAQATNSFVIGSLSGGQVRVDEIAVYVQEPMGPAGTPGDFTGDETVTNEDVVYLLWHTLFPDSYPIYTNADFANDGAVNNADVVYLLWHTLFPEEYPL